MPRNIALNEKMRAESRAKILASASSLFAQKGYFSVKIADIAQRAGMSQGNAYWYFASKEDILKAILADGFDAVEAMLVSVETTPESAKRKLLRLIELQMALLQEQKDFFAVFMSVLGHGGMAFMSDLGFDTQSIGQRYHLHLHTILGSAIRDGVLPPAEVGWLAMLFFSLFNGLQLTYADTWTQVPPAFLRDAVLRLLGFQGRLPVEKS